MVLRKQVRIFSGCLSFLAITVLFSCEKTFPGMILCTECFDDEPLMALLDIKMSANSSFRISSLEVYEGKLEDSILYKSYDIAAATTRISVAINKEYTLVAKYYFMGNYYYVVNSVLPRVKYDELQCEKPCYYIIDKSVDLRLRHVK